MCYCFIWFLSNLGPSPCSFQRSKWCSCRSGCSAFTVLCCLVWSLSWPEGQKQFLKDQFYSKGYYKPPPPSSSLCIQCFKLLMSNSLSPKYLLVPLPPNKNLKRIILKCNLVYRGNVIHQGQFTFWHKSNCILKQVFAVYGIQET